MRGCTFVYLCLCACVRIRAQMCECALVYVDRTLCAHMYALNAYSHRCLHACNLRVELTWSSIMPALRHYRIMMNAYALQPLQLHSVQHRGVEHRAKRLGPAMREHREGSYYLVALCVFCVRACVCCIVLPLLACAVLVSFGPRFASCWDP